MNIKRCIVLLSLVLVVLSMAVSAKVSLLSYCDVTLESCKKQDQALEILADKYPLDLQVDYLYYFDMSDAKKSMAHIALECANWQSMKAEYKSELQNNLDDLSRSALKEYADNVGLYMSNFTICLDTGMSAWDVLDEVVEADEDGVSTAPSIRVNMDIYTGSQTFTSLHDLVKKYIGLDGVVIVEEVSEESYEETAGEDTTIEETSTEELTEENTIAEETETQGEEEVLFFKIMRKFWNWLISPLG